MIDKNAAAATEEAVDNSGGSDPTDALMDSLISEVEQEFQDAELAAMPDGEATADAPAEVDAKDESNVEAAPEEGEPGEDDAPAEETDRSVERLVAREVELRQREEKLKGAEERYTKLEQENAQLRQQFEEVNARIPVDLVEDLRTSPRKALEAVGYDPDHIVRVILAEKLVAQGKPVPKELQDEIKSANYEHKQRQLEKRQADFEQRQAAQRFVEKTEADARQYIRAMSELKPEFSKNAPTVAKVAKANPDRVFAEIMDEIGRDAQARKREPGAQLISFAEAARRVESRWADFTKLVGNPAAASTSADETTARDQQTGASATAGKQLPAKKAVKPLTPPAKPKTAEELENEGIEAGLAEFKRLEMAKRKASAPLRK